MNNDDPFFYRVPEDWDVTKVGAYCQKPEYGFTESAIADEIGPKFLRITDITENGVNWDTVPYCRCPQDIFPKYELKENDILFARIGATTGKSFIAKDPPQAVFASYLIRLRPLNDLVPDFLYYFFNSDGYWDQVNANKNNNLKGGVNSSTLADIRFPLPPKKEQQKIAAVLYKIQKAIEIQESIIAKTRELKCSTLHHVFTYGLRGEKLKETEIGPMPESWFIRKIGALGKIVTGTTPPTKHKEYYQGGHYQFIAPNDIGKTTRIYETEKKITDKGLEVSRLLPKESVCFVCIGSTIGKVGITVEERTTTNQQANAVIVENDYDPYFVTYLMDYKSEYIASFASPSPVPILSKGKFEEINIMLSSDIEEQREIARVLMTIDETIEIHTAKKSALQNLFKTMLNKLMTGEIRVKDLDIDVSEVSA